MKKLFKKILCFLLSLIIALSSCVISAYAESTLDGAVPGSINLYISDKGTINELRAMQLNDIIYVDATELANLLECRFIKTDNYIFFAFGRTYYNFYYSSKKVGVVYASWINNVGETSFESIAETIKDDEHNAVWVPLRFTLAVLNCDFIIGNECIITSIPKSTVFDLQYDWIKNKKRYSFDWNDDYFIDDVNVDTMRKSAYVVQLINGMISMDATSIVESVSCLNRDISGYDIKYGQDFSRLYVVPSADELDSINSIISKAVKPYNNTAKVIKNINGTISELSQNTANSAKVCQQYIKDLGSINDNIADFNKNFSQIKKNANEEAKWLKNTELLREIDKAINFEGISDAVSTAADVISIITYASEYMYNDKFSVASMDWFLNNDYSKEYLSKATLNSCSTYIKSLDTNVVAYSAYRYFCDNIGSILGDSVKALGGKGVSSAIGANANWMLFAWSIAKNTIPFFKDGLSNTDKMLLTTYAQCFQYEAYRYVKEISDKVFVNNSVNEDYLNDYVMSWYSFFKSAYICRDAALGVSDDIPQFRIDDQNQKNKEIASNLSFLRQASFENDKPEKYVGTIFGFLPSVRKEFSKSYNETPVINVFVPVKEEYDITNYMTITNEGSDGNITVSYEWNVDAVNEFKELLKENHWLTDDECNKLFKSIEIEITPNSKLKNGDIVELKCNYDNDYFNEKGVYLKDKYDFIVNAQVDRDVYYEYLANNDDGIKLSNCIIEEWDIINMITDKKAFEISNKRSGVIGGNFYDYDNDGSEEMLTISIIKANGEYNVQLKLDYFDYIDNTVTLIDTLCADDTSVEWYPTPKFYLGSPVFLESYANSNQIGIISEIATTYSATNSVKYIDIYSVSDGKITLEQFYSQGHFAAAEVEYLKELVSGKVYYEGSIVDDDKYNEFLNDIKNSFIYPYVTNNDDNSSSKIASIEANYIDTIQPHYRLHCETDLADKVKEKL